ncbi:GGDEF domain-containing protein [Comamonas sp. GB3 AK4-5]|uniref:GGDEF domain-containing protein n=1 Tax=Comamonas sp. GB3 AK4-5 TaxID=3231487 RepID=UPI00351F1320
MTVGNYYALSLPLCTSLLALGFVVCWRWQRAQQDALWMAACLALFSLGLAGQVLTPPLPLRGSAVVMAMLYQGAAWCLVEAMCWRLGRRPARWLQALLVGLAMVARIYCIYTDAPFYMRVYALNLGLGAQLAVGTWRLWGQRPALRLERSLRLLFAMLILSFFVRTPTTVPASEGLTKASLAALPFWGVLQLSMLAFALLFAMLYVAITMRDALVQLQEERNRDPLTQLLNRRAFLEALKHGDRRQAVGTVLVCDVDHFKQVNDRWGHAAGDAVLQGFARTLQDCVREGDLVARFGGEEFVLLLYGLAPQDAVLVAERIRQRLRSMRLANLPPDQRVTASFGVAPVLALSQWHEAIAQADRLLYAAKAAGRDCVRWEPVAEVRP